jgi:hypothetical protein
MLLRNFRNTESRQVLEGSAFIGFGFNKKRRNPAPDLGVFSN